MSAEVITYFGYGSLVNRQTRPASERAQPARLYGWQRVWGHRVQGSADAGTGARRSCCSLSVEPASVYADVSANISADISTKNEKSSHVSFIDGVVVSIPVSELPTLDLRENGYDRIQISANEFDLPSDCSDTHIHVYRSDASHAGLSNHHYPILQSYVDCVLAGYCAVFEQVGMQHFVDSTVGWGGVIENEREAPKYPRAVSLPKSQLDLIDALVSKRRLRVDD